MRMVPIILAATMALVAVPAFTGHAQAAGPVQLQDAGFMKNAAQSSMAEVADGKMAARRTYYAEIKTFAQAMMTDHAKATAELQVLAKKHNVGLPMGPDVVHQTTSRAMYLLPGKTFDKTYVANQVKDHENAIALFEAEIENGKVAEAKAWAAKMLPTLKMHLKHAQSLNAKLNK